MSDVAITNNALGKLGDDPIVAMTDTTERAILANRIYTDVRDATLRAHEWNFALKRATLSSSGTPLFEFTYQYSLPSDYLRVLKINTITGKWKIENGKLLSDVSSVKILYVFRETDTTKYDTLFTEAFAARLASEMAIPLTGKISIAKEMWELYKGKLTEARLADVEEESLYTSDEATKEGLPVNIGDANLNTIDEQPNVIIPINLGDVNLNTTEEKLENKKPVSNKNKFRK